MKKVLLAGVAASALLMGAATAQAGDLKAVTGLSVLDMGLATSGTLGFVGAETNLTEVGDFETGVQLRLGTSLAPASETLGALTLDFGFNYIVSGFYKFGGEVADGINAYGLLGYSYADIQVDLSSGGVTASGATTDSSFSYGVGANYDLGDGFAVGGEYIAYWSDVTSFGATVSYTY